MAFDTPGHSQWLLPRDSVHGFYRPMTLLALQIRLDMPFMREMHKIRHVIHLDPWNRLLISVILGDLYDLGRVGGNRYVTAHAFFDRGYARRWRPGGINMAVLARNFVIPGMNFMTEFDRLHRTGVIIIGAIYPDSRDKTGQTDKNNQGRFLKMLDSLQNRN